MSARVKEGVVQVIDSYATIPSPIVDSAEDEAGLRNLGLNRAGTLAGGVLAHE